MQLTKKTLKTAGKGLAAYAILRFVVLPIVIIAALVAVIVALLR